MLDFFPWFSSILDNIKLCYRIQRQTKIRRKTENAWKIDFTFLKLEEIVTFINKTLNELSQKIIKNLNTNYKSKDDDNFEERNSSKKEEFRKSKKKNLNLNKKYYKTV